MTYTLVYNKCNCSNRGVLNEFENSTVQANVGKHIDGALRRRRLVTIADYFVMYDGICIWNADAIFALQEQQNSGSVKRKNATLYTYV